MPEKFPDPHFDHMRRVLDVADAVNGAMPLAPLQKRLAEAMKRSRGHLNPRQVMAALSGELTWPRKIGRLAYDAEWVAPDRYDDLPESIRTAKDMWTHQPGLTDEARDLLLRWIREATDLLWRIQHEIPLAGVPAPQSGNGEST